MIFGGNIQILFLPLRRLCSILIFIIPREALIALPNKIPLLPEEWHIQMKQIFIMLSKSLPQNNNISVCEREREGRKK